MMISNYLCRTVETYELAVKSVCGQRTDGVDTAVAGIDRLLASIAVPRRFYINVLPLSIFRTKALRIVSLEESCTASCRQSATILAAFTHVETSLTHGEYAASETYWWYEVER